GRCAAGPSVAREPPEHSSRGAEDRYGCGATLGSRAAAATEPSSVCKPRRRRKSSSETTPTPTPNQSVQKRISSVATTALGPVISSTSRNSPALLASAAPSPPGRSEAEPTSVLVARTKAARISKPGVGAKPSPARIRKKATHSPDQETTPMASATSSGRQLSNT